MLLELHTHTFYSKGERILYEGVNSPKEMVKHAAKIGLGGIAITDHDTMQGVKTAVRYGKKLGVVVIPGEEITTLNGHVIALGINERVLPGLALDETLEKIRDQGGVSIAAHPFDIINKGVGGDCYKTDVIEVFNAFNIDRVINRKAKRFAKAQNLPTTAGSDAHWVNMIGYGITEVDANGLDSVLKAIKKGKTIIHRRYIPMRVMTDWTILRLKLSYYYIDEYMHHNYKWPKRVVGTRLLKLVQKSPGKIDFAFRGLAYLILGFATSYAFLRDVLDRVR